MDNKENQEYNSSDEQQQSETETGKNGNADVSFWQDIRIRHVMGIKVFSAAFMAAVAAGIILLSKLSEPKPPSPDVVASYNEKNITIEELKAFIVTEGSKDKEHYICEKHGFDHSLCDASEDCEKHPVDSLEGYKAAIQIMASEQIILDWAEAKGIAQREDVRHEISDLFDNANVEEVVNQIYEQQLSPDSISKLDVQLYFDQNREQYEGKNLSDVEAEIRQILLSQKKEDYFSKYIEELKKTAGLDVNYDLLKLENPASDEKGVLFAVHGRRYTLGDFYREFLELPESYQKALNEYDGKKLLLDQLIVKELLLEKDSDVAGSESKQHDMEELKIQYLMQVMHEEEVEQKLSDPTEEEVQAFYETNKNRFFVRKGDKEEATQLTLEEVRASIVEHLKAEKHSELTIEMEKNILEESGLVVYDRTIKKLLKRQGEENF